MTMKLLIISDQGEINLAACVIECAHWIELTELVLSSFPDITLLIIFIIAFEFQSFYQGGLSYCTEARWSWEQNQLEGLAI